MPSSSSSSSSSTHWTVALVASAGGAIAAVVVVVVAAGLLRRKDDRSGGPPPPHDYDDDDGETPPVGSGGGGGAVVEITLPEWAASDEDDAIAGMYARRYTTDDEMMSLAIRMSDTNVKMGTGGPFGAAIFERVRRLRRPTHGGGGEMNEGEGEEEEEEYCTLVSVGMNRVVPLNNSTLHAEMVAIQIAQSKLGSFTLSDMMNDGGNVSNDNICRKFELFTSCEPCAMCLGGTLWSGVSRLVTGATKDDAQSIGFDEGPVNDESYVYLENAGITVTRNVMRDEAADVLRRYGRGGVIYNRCPSSVVDG